MSDFWSKITIPRSITHLSVLPWPFRLYNPGRYTILIDSPLRIRSILAYLKNSFFSLGVSGCRMQKFEVVCGISHLLSLRWPPYVALSWYIYGLCLWNHWFGLNRRIVHLDQLAVVKNCMCIHDPLQIVLGGVQCPWASSMFTSTLDVPYLTLPRSWFRRVHEVEDFDRVFRWYSIHVPPNGHISSTMSPISVRLRCILRPYAVWAASSRPRPSATFLASSSSLAGTCIWEIFFKIFYLMTYDDWSICLVLEMVELAEFFTLYI